LNRFLNNNLPEFLVQGKPGLENGLMGTQFTATALVAENRTIGPASTQSVPSNGDNQDVVSMGLISGRNARRILANNQYILAVEYLAAAQAVDILHCQSELSKAGQATYRKVRELVKTVDRDRFMSDDLEVLAAALAQGAFARVISEEGITLA
ncbi:MAG: aromatic amino acid lyase, partial [Ktedonobacteraceae bacterium]